jgi:hypothetical protein
VRTRALAVIVLAAGCATGGSPGQGDVDLPNAGVGPFRKLDPNETLGIAPFVFDDRRAVFREPGALVRGAGENGPEVWLYAVAKDQTTGKDVIVRTHATDGRSFYGTTQHGGHAPVVVLTPTEPWEGDALAGPAPLEAGGEIFLYYAGKGGIGVARSTDGIHFRKEGGPILSRDDHIDWETAQLSGPSAAILPSGRFRLFYAGGAGIGEADSSDGVHFARHDAEPGTPGVDPVLRRALFTPGEPAPFDMGEVADPHAMLRTTEAGRLHVRVLYTGYDKARGEPDRVGAIGFAARYGPEGALSRGGPVYAVGKEERAPTAVEWAGKTLLYVEQKRDGLGGESSRAIAAALAPADQHLGTPDPFPDAP